MHNRVGRSLLRGTAALLGLVCCLEAVAQTGGLLGDVDGSKASDWGTCVRIPPDTGEFVVTDGTMTVHRKRPGGDFKIYRVFKGIEPGQDYILSFQIRVDAKTPAQVGVMHGADGRHWEWCAKPVAFEPSPGWQPGAIRFTGSAGKPLGCLQLLPPTDLNARITFGLLSVRPVRAPAVGNATGDESVYPSYRLDRAPTVDGTLDDQAWALLPEVCGFAQLGGAKSPGDGLQVIPDGVETGKAPVEFETGALTFFQAGHTDDALYLAVRCYQPGADTLPAGTENKADLWREDCAEIHVLPGAGKSKAQFLTNSVGAHWPDTGWEVRTTRRRSSWLAEVRIPFAMLQAKPAPGDAWPINLARHATTPRDTLSTWSPRLVNFHDDKHYRTFEFRSDSADASRKAADEEYLNRSFQRAQTAPDAEQRVEDTGDSVKTHVAIHVRNVDAALFVNGRRVTLKARVWPTSYKGFMERSLNAVVDTLEGENVFAVVAQANGPEPGIRIVAGRPETDGRWRCARLSPGDWARAGYDDRDWLQVEAGESRKDNFYWPVEAEQLAFRQVIRGVEACSQDVAYSVCDWERDDLGRHRAIVRAQRDQAVLSETVHLAYRLHYTTKVVWAHLPWRRRDVAPEKKGIRVFDSKTGKQVTNVVVLNCKQEYGDIVFEPPTVPGDYEIYYMPYFPMRGSPRLWGMTDPYRERFEEPDPVWVNRVAVMIGDQGIARYQMGDLSRGDWQRLPRAELVEIQAKTQFDRVDPMEVVATREEIDTLLTAAAERPYLVFPEDRAHPVRMFETIPLRWIKSGPRAQFAGSAQPDEYYCYQLGIFATAANVSGMEVEFSELCSPAGKRIPVEAMTCFNLGGRNWLGEAFVKTFTLDAGRVRPLWIGVQIPPDAEGEYTGTVTVKPTGLPPTQVEVALTVTGPQAVHHGDDNPRQHTRLRWLNSDLGIDDDWLVPPFTALEAKGDRIACLDRTVTFGPTGFPARVVSREHDVLAAPIELSARVDGAVLAWVAAGEPETVLAKKGRIVRVYTANAGGVRLTNRVSMECDGCVLLDVTLSSDAATTLGALELRVPYSRAVAEYMAGANGPGGYRVAQKDWPFAAGWNSNSKLWLGNVQAGMQLKAATGAGRLREDGAAVVVSNVLGDVALEPGKPRSFSWRLLITPFKRIPPMHWRTRIGEPLAKAGSLQALATLQHIHHGRPENPWINYPFLYTDKLQDLQRRIAQRGGLGVQLYYTVRELTTRCCELWALRSLGDEVFSGADAPFRANARLDQGNGFPWLREHLVAGYYKAWRTWGTYDTDAAISQRGLSRWHNYYVEGLDWLLREKCFYSLYLDGIGYDRDIMKRVARIMSRHYREYRIEHHQCTNPEGTNSVINQYLEHMPYVTELWYGESFNYNKPPDYWLVEVSGLPFGVTGEMLDNTGTINMYRGMVYGITGRIGGREDIWKLWDDFGIADAQMLGYWDKRCPVRTDCTDVPVTVFRKDGKSLIALASWSRKPETVTLEVDWAALGLDRATAVLRAPAVGEWQAEASFKPGEPLPLPVGKGWFLIAEPAQ